VTSSVDARKVMLLESCGRTAVRRSAWVWVGALALLSAGAVQVCPAAEEAVLPPVKAVNEAAFLDAVQRLSGEIEGGQLEGERLAAAYLERGVAYSNLYRNEESIADLSKAIELDPLNAAHYEDRAVVYVRVGNVAAAQADIDMALGLDRSRPYAWRDQGRMAWHRGDYEQAARYFANSLQYADRELAPYAVLWLYLAAERAGKDGSAPLNYMLARLEPGAWPYPLLSLFAGTLTAEQTLAAAASRNARLERERRCEALFYTGEFYLLRGNRERATQLFRDTLETGVTEFLEYDWARFELERLLTAK
jgi:lipoprotein NlpI